MARKLKSRNGKVVETDDDDLADKLEEDHGAEYDGDVDLSKQPWNRGRSR